MNTLPKTTDVDLEAMRIAWARSPWRRRSMSFEKAITLPGMRAALAGLAAALLRRQQQGDPTPQLRLI